MLKQIDPQTQKVWLKLKKFIPHSHGTKIMLLVGASSSLHFFQRQANSSSAIFNMHPQRPPWGSPSQPMRKEQVGSVLEVFCWPGLGVSPITSAHLQITGPQSHSTPSSQGRLKHPGGHGFGEELTDCHCGLLRIFVHHASSSWPSPGLLPLFLCSRV